MMKLEKKSEHISVFHRDIKVLGFVFQWRQSDRKIACDQSYSQKLL